MSDIGRPRGRKIYFGTRRARNAEYIYKIARTAGLSNPLGRAIYLNSRWGNAGFGYYSSGRPGVSETLAALHKIKESTAARWLAHWEAGGCQRVLGRTVAQQNLQRRVRYLQRDIEVASYRLHSAYSNEEEKRAALEEMTVLRNKIKDLQGMAAVDDLSKEADHLRNAHWQALMKEADA